MLPDPRPFTEAPKDGSVLLGRLENGVWIAIEYLKTTSQYCWMGLQTKVDMEANLGLIEKKGVEPYYYMDDSFTHWIPVGDKC